MKKTTITMMTLAFSILSTSAATVATTQGSVESKYQLRANDNINWTSVTITTPGSLGQEVLYQVNMLSDVEYLRVKGNMNNDDWQTIKNMENLKGADLSQAIAEAVPDNQFYEMREFHIILLPQGIKRIGERAFYKTQIGSITIPATVTEIANDAFREVKQLKTVDMAAGSQLSKIGAYAFNSCESLEAINLPNGISILENATFFNCKSLTTVVLPATLQGIGNDCFAYTEALRHIDFPQSMTYINSFAFGNSGLEEVVLPQGMTFLGGSTFSDCKNLKTVELPATPTLEHEWWSWENHSGYDSNFSGCYAIEKVICHSATPPSVSNAPFGDVDLSKVTLVVPAFAIVDYKLDNYWHQFGTIVEGANPTVLNIGSTLSLINNRRPSGKPDVLLSEGARLTVDGNAPFESSSFTFTINYPSSTYGQLQNNTTAMNTDRMTTRFYINSYNWYFITPLHDVNVADVSHSDAEASFIFRYYNAQNRAVNGPSMSWQNLTENTLKAGQGYIVQANRNGWITMPATVSGKAAAFVSDDVTMTMKAMNAANSTDANWNYLGNPYPCYYDTYYMDISAPITVRDYGNWTYRAYSPIDDHYVLRPMEAFFVQKPASQNTILFQKEGRQFTPDIQTTASARANQQTNRTLFDIQISDGSLNDVTRLVINSEASTSYESARDAAKFISNEASIPQLYTIDSQDNRLAINERPLADGNVRLGLQISQPGTYTFSLSRGSAPIILTDAANGQNTDLSHQDYTFSITQTGNEDNRFTLSFGNTNSIVPTQNGTNQPNELLYDLQGRGIKRQPQHGLYIKRDATGNGKKYIVK